MNHLNYHHLRYFRAVAHDGNLTRTAGRLNLSQSALSTQIRQLEDSIGHALFERRGRQLALTEVGRITLDYADVIFTTGEELLVTLQGAGAVRKAIRIGAMATLSRNFQITFLQPLLGRDDVDIILRSGTTRELLRELEALNLDIVLMNQPWLRDATTNFVSHRLAEQQVSLIGRPDCFAPDDDIARLLESSPVIIPTLDSNIRLEFDALIDRLGIQATIAAEVDDMAMMRLLAREGVGLAAISPIVVKDELSTGMLIEYHQLPNLTESFYAVVPERKFPNPMIQELLRQNMAARQAFQPQS
ncbi:LysR family transcriptional regulator [Aestuariispira insulae]|uniref:LysR family transcriptional regulator n=1 Tax=Aestuariispira insulae TaxID=1461337 RepID=A0A3D9HI22_9PROT|nr:LysR family transcriptional regulator [Aestuariispira insulae]RED49147.1 LysR family transcriptional regulator [Aestuariispira insulae]